MMICFVTIKWSVMSHSVPASYEPRRLPLKYFHSMGAAEHPFPFIFLEIDYERSCSRHRCYF